VDRDPVTFLDMLVTAGIRATPRVMMVPLETSFGWTRTTISLALAITCAVRMMGPVCGCRHATFRDAPHRDRALAILGGGVAVSSRMNAAWQMVLIWGVLVGGATGATSMTLGAACRGQRTPCQWRTATASARSVIEVAPVAPPTSTPQISTICHAAFISV